MKLLIREGNHETLTIIRQEAEMMGMKVLVAEDGESMLNLAKREYPSLIIMDIKLLSEGGKSMVLEELQRSLATREIPLLLTHSSPDIAWQEKYRILGVREMLLKPLDRKAFRKIVVGLLQEGNGPMCFSERFARSFAAYNRTDSLAEQMIAKATIAARIHGYDDASLYRINSALAILSVPVLHQNLSEVLSLCANAMLSHEVLQLLQDAQNPVDQDAILVNAIVQLAQKEEGVSPLYAPTFFIDHTIYTTVTEIFDSGLIRIRRDEEIQLVWRELSEKILEAKEYSLREVSDFLEYSLESARTVLLRNHEVYVRLCGNTTVPKVELFFADGEETLSEMAPQSQEALEITLGENDGGHILARTGTLYRKLVVSLKEKVPGEVKETEAVREPKETVVDMFEMIGAMTVTQSAVEEEAMHAQDTISAEEFLNMTRVDPEDLDTLEELEGEITREVDHQEGTDRFETIQAIVGYFRKYATTIMYISEFTQMVDGLLELSGTLEGMEPGIVDEKRQQLILALLERLVDDLYEWRKAIFIKRDCEDIHFMDDSIIASCRQVQSFLPKTAVAETEESAAITLF